VNLKIYDMLIRKIKDYKGEIRLFFTRDEKDFDWLYELKLF
jgi:hypothetical protein